MSELASEPSTQREPTAAPPVHDLLLALAGRLDDDILAWARELAAVGEPDQAIELATAALAAERVVLPPTLRAALVAAAHIARTDLNVERALPPGASDPGTRHRFDAAGAPGEAVVAALTALPARRLAGCTLHLTWRQTPAGAAPGPLPRAVVLVEADPDRSPDVLAYLLATELERAGVPASVEVFTAGSRLPAYHVAALGTAREIVRGAVAPDAPAEPDTPAVPDVPAVPDAPTERASRQHLATELADSGRTDTATDVTFSGQFPPTRGGRADEAADEPDPPERSGSGAPLRVVPPPVTAQGVADGVAEPAAVAPDPAPTPPDPPAAESAPDPLSGPLRAPLMAPLLEPRASAPPDEPAPEPAPVEAGSAEHVEPTPAEAELPDEWADDWRSGDWAMPPTGRSDAAVDQPASAGPDASAPENTARRGPSRDLLFRRGAVAGRPRPARAEATEDSLFDSPTRAGAMPPTPDADRPVASAAPDPTRPPADDPLFGPMREVPLFGQGPAPGGRRRRPEPDEPASDAPPVEPGTSGQLSGTERDLLAQLQAELAARQRPSRPYRRAGRSSGTGAVNGHADGPNGDRTRPTWPAERPPGGV
jgi:hypothetical protein